MFRAGNIEEWTKTMLEYSCLIDESGKNILLEVDGHVSWDLCKKMRECGADIFVAGSSSLYQEGLDLCEAVERMNDLVK